MEDPVSDNNSLTKTRTTRLIYVEETSDTEHRPGRRKTTGLPPKAPEKTPANANIETEVKVIRQKCEDVRARSSGLAGANSTVTVLEDKPQDVSAEKEREVPLMKLRSLDIDPGLEKEKGDDCSPALQRQHSVENDVISIAHRLRSGSAHTVDWPLNPRPKLKRSITLNQKSLKAFQNCDEMLKIKDTLLYEKLKSLINFMKLCGIFFIPKQGSFRNRPLDYIRSFTALQVYCLTIVLILASNFVRTLAAFNGMEGFDSELFFKLLASIFAYESMSRAYLAYWCCKTSKGFRHIFVAMDRICFTDGIVPYEGPLRRTMLAFIGLSVLVAVGNGAMVSWFNLRDHSQLREALLYPIDPKAAAANILGICLVIMTVLNSLVAMLTLTLYTCLCYGLYKEFEYFARMFAMKIREDGAFSDDLEKFRLNHHKRCALLSDVDQCLKYYIANTYLTNVPLMCILLYSVVYNGDHSSAYQVLGACNLLYVFLQMLVVSAAATIINTQAHAPLENMHSIRVSNGQSPRQVVMTMFLNKLTGAPIGLTAWDMFVINKPAVLTVVGMVMTYFFLLLQFKNPLLSSIHCNCLVDVLNNVTTVESVVV